MHEKTNLRSQRKDQHVKYTLAQERQISTDFNNVHLIHQSVPSIDIDSVDLSSNFGAFQFEHPVYINAMTGGSEWTKSINAKLAQVAAEVNVPMAVGSMHAALKDGDLMESFQIVRKYNPHGLIFANVGADVSVEDAMRVVEMIEADALQIHINAPQELIMPEGDRHFKDWKMNITEIVQALNIPVIVKEVGFGMSKETVNLLIECGIKYIDVSGKGGTNFAEIENNRRPDHDMDFLKNWGLSTVISLVEAKPFQKKMNIMASGGISSPLDAIKSIALGANAVGMSRVLLKKVNDEGVEETVLYIREFLKHMKKISVMVSAGSIEELQRIPVVLSPEIISWKSQREL